MTFIVRESSYISQLLYISQPSTISNSVHHLLSTSFCIEQNSENLQELCKIKNLDTGEEVDLNDVQLATFDSDLRSLIKMDDAEVKDFM